MPRITTSMEYSRERGPHRNEISVWATYCCPRGECRKPTSVFFLIYDGPSTGPYIADEPAQIPRGQAQPMDALPEPIQIDRLEAWSCLYGADYRAAVIMARAAVQRAVRQLKAKGDGLKAEINDLAMRRKITDALRDAAHEVRISGDDAAHPADLGVVTRAEARDSLDFMDDFLEHAIAMPNRAATRKLARKPQNP